MNIKQILVFEKELYKSKVFYSNSFFMAWLKNEAPYMIWRWQRNSRLSDYYRSKKENNNGINAIIASVLYLYYIRKKQKLAERLGLEIGTRKIGKGLIVYHFNNVVNGNATIGENCHIHGTVVIGNNGITEDAPIIGNNVMIGAGAKVIGGITIADNIKIAAGAVVVHSFTEPGITLAGIPAIKVSK